MTNYVKTADFASKDALATGTPLKALKGTELGLEFDNIALMSVSKLDVAAAANPTNSVGLSIVNGTAVTYMRSDAAPALSQAVVPTWTGIHTFSVAPVMSAGALLQNNSAGIYSATFNQTTAATTVATQYQRQGAVKAIVGVVGVLNDTVTGSAIDDLVVRTQGGNQLFSVNSGASPALKLTSGGLVQAVDQGGTLQDVGWRDLPVNTQAGIYTLALSDRGKMIIANNTITIPANASTAFPLGASVLIFNNTGGNISVAITTDTLQLAGTATTGTRTIAQNGYCTLLKWSATAWFASGPGVS